MKRNRWLLELRRRKKLTQEAVAKLAGIERSYFTKIENGTVPSVKVAKRIAAILDFHWTRFYDQYRDERSQNEG